MKIDLLTPFPKLIDGFFSDSILKRAQEQGLVRIKVWDLRQFTTDKHKTVDDYPYGGGPGMILKAEPIFLAVDKIQEVEKQTSPRIILMTPQGVKYSQVRAEALSREEHLVFICGHYRGVDERIVEALVTDEISIGDYILSGGEIAAAVIVDSVVRLIPGVLGNLDSAKGDSFSNGQLDYPHYTRPEVCRGMAVPEVLLSGHHAKVKAWREKQALNRTYKKRPDLLNGKK
jgi:tRNA (guanine37-N1)-methyltransferase